ncbi:hypothetical protein GGI04_003585 [Coemansia thaxteri]|nr:hypothetical protein GGI04_003585 [Coemansia thaxteri]KAJ2472188.1 hypothetical protein EV174_005860 [Coemansia sp. RSA 2320]
MSSILWFVGDLPANGHVRLRGVFSNCKLWIIWFRVLYCFVFASLLILRFFALDRVFNQNKSFSNKTSVISLAVVVIFNIAYCLSGQLVADEKTVYGMPSLEVCDSTMGYRVACVILQWTLWVGVAVLIYRLRNIQTSFNEYRESLAIFVVAIILLTETTVTNVVFRNYPLQLVNRLEKTAMDVLASNIMIWLIVAHPVYMCLFHRRRYETMWLEKLTREGHKAAYDVSSGHLGHTTSYAKMDESAFNHTQLNFGSADAMASAYYGGRHPYYEGDTMVLDPVLRENMMFQNPDTLPIALRNNLHIHRPVLNTPSMFATGFAEPQTDGRRVI